MITKEKRDELIHKEAVRRYNAGESAERISADMGVSKSVIHKWLMLYAKNAGLNYLWRVPNV